MLSSVREVENFHPARELGKDSYTQTNYGGALGATYVIVLGKTVEWSGPLNSRDCTGQHGIFVSLGKS
jgi:hypothetical protein